MGKEHEICLISLYKFYSKYTSFLAEMHSGIYVLFNSVRFRPNLECIDIYCTPLNVHFQGYLFNWFPNCFMCYSVRWSVETDCPMDGAKLIDALQVCERA
jgi:hypothetical protein